MGAGKGAGTSGEGGSIKSGAEGGEEMSSTARDDQWKEERADAIGQNGGEGLHYDAINPSHYRQGGVECIDALDAATIGKAGIEAVCTANIIKYLWRYESKNGVEDVRKARWYLDRLLRELEQ